MRTPAAVGLVVVLLLAATTGSVVALQEGPPEHAEGNGPPEHAEGDGEGPPADAGSSNGGGDQGNDDVDGEDESAGGESDAEGGGDDGTDGTDDPTATDAATSTDAPTSTDTSITTDSRPSTDTPTSMATPTSIDTRTSTDTPPSMDTPIATDPGTATDTSTSTDTPSSTDVPTTITTPTPVHDADRGPTETVTTQVATDAEDAGSQGGSEQAATTEHDGPSVPTVDDDDDTTPTSTSTDEDGTATPSGDDDDTGSSEDGDDNPWSSVGSDDSEDSDPAGGASVEIRTNESATVVEVTGAEAGDTVEADLHGPATDGRGVAVESLAIEVGEDGSSTTAVTRPTAESDLESAPGVPVAYFDVGSDAAVEQATLTLDVDEDTLPEGVAPADLEVLRYQDGEWESVETTDDEETGVRTVETSGSGQFAVAAPGDGPIEVANVEVIDDGNGSGGERTVRATVENTGDREATRTVAATIDGETVATREVTLAPGEAATLAFDLPAERGTVAVGGVEAEQRRAQGTDSGAVPAPASTNGNLAFGVGAAVLVVLSAAATGLLAARHEDWDWEL